MSSEKHFIVNESSFNTETDSGAGLMRNRCAFTSRDQAADWPEAFTYAIVKGWDAKDEDDPEDVGAMAEVAEKFGWDESLVAFLRDAHERFKQLPDKIQVEKNEGER